MDVWHFSGWPPQAPGSGQAPQSIRKGDAQNEGEVEAQSGRDETTCGTKESTEEGEDDCDEATFKG